ncbi:MULTISPECIES: DNA repair protein RecN [unclassified Planococcus (in: firmicutes)]|uniref:DNA repair protein RecN n=1 Tax=unclassified Planococcus (in: firmicutes) TaxID=2662419 RepID=UPI000C32EE45|nr:MULTISPECIES: DNA repair protein RecN [unclassified Planococcus (in: firmicutes)]AUD13800.1 DNA repair protein RecN [Planococcus sp. MB-3u-03]PKG45714.1 DNA repair protein RecN [Planococcus sp. Urea-trap-24]PKG88576.1 DNA repair protein RecN [Planococcus sp. Urea-3u-39]PKH38705.1 DNA repair protein RecN [Planococcus sp. MB-3u-09]
MLRELDIRNFAIIDTLSVSFTEGMTVLTGETGAGKSIIIDAVHLLAGGRGSQEFIRHGAQKAEIEGLFHIESEKHPVHKKLEDFGIQASDGDVLLRRELNGKGKNVCRINGKLVTISILREVGAALIDIHGQHETQELMDEKQHLHLLDQFAGKLLTKAKEGYSHTFEKYTKLKREFASYNENEQQIAQRIDLLTFQLNEIEEAQLVPGEEETLLEDRKRLQNFTKIFESISQAHEAIQGESKGLDWVGNAMSELEHAAAVDEQFKEASESVTGAFYQLQDTSTEIKRILDQLEFDPERLNEIEQRLALLQSLKRKYGASVEDMLLYQEEQADELDKLLNRDQRLRLDQEKLKELTEDLRIEAEELTMLRKQAAAKLSKAIMEQLKELHMGKASFSVQFNLLPKGKLDRFGQDSIAFHISTNVGEPLKPLTKVASGGELSRMMLALKTIFSKHQGITSIIFDEVDTGVSGRVAQAIAEKIAAIARHSQVLCISHLPQVAAMADQHLFIEKKVSKDRTTTSVKELAGRKRTEEMSRMLSGAEITELTLQHADELLTLARDRKLLMK